MDDEEEILEDKQQVLALQWTCKELNAVSVFAYHIKPRSRWRGVLSAAHILFIKDYFVKLSIKILKIPLGLSFLLVWRGNRIK